MVDKQYSSKMKWREIKMTKWMRKESKEEGVRKHSTINKGKL